MASATTLADPCPGRGGCPGDGTGRAGWCDRGARGLVGHGEGAEGLASGAGPGVRGRGQCHRLPDGEPHGPGDPGLLERLHPERGPERRAGEVRAAALQHGALPGADLPVPRPRPQDHRLLRQFAVRRQPRARVRAARAARRCERAGPPVEHADLGHRDGRLRHRGVRGALEASQPVPELRRHPPVFHRGRPQLRRGRERPLRHARRCPGLQRAHAGPRRRLQHRLGLRDRRVRQPDDRRACGRDVRLGAAGRGRDQLRAHAGRVRHGGRRCRRRRSGDGQPGHAAVDHRALPRQVPARGPVLLRWWRAAGPPVLPQRHPGGPRSDRAPGHGGAQAAVRLHTPGDHRHLGGLLGGRPGGRPADPRHAAERPAGGQDADADLPGTGSEDGVGGRQPLLHLRGRGVQAAEPASGVERPEVAALPGSGVHAADRARHGHRPDGPADLVDRERSHGGAVHGGRAGPVGHQGQPPLHGADLPGLPDRPVRPGGRHRRGPAGGAAPDRRAPEALEAVRVEPAADQSQQGAP